MPPLARPGILAATRPPLPGNESPPHCEAAALSTRTRPAGSRDDSLLANCCVPLASAKGAYLPSTKDEERAPIAEPTKNVLSSQPLCSVVGAVLRALGQPQSPGMDQSVPVL